jgi:hypothetical protein
VKRSLAIVAMMASSAHAEPEVIATQPLALVTRGMEVSFERELAARWSWVAEGGVRLGALGDYDASTFTVGGDARRWMRRSTEMRGPYIGLHASVGRTTMSDSMGDIGASLGFTERVDVGWRWVIHDTVSITPSIGAGTIQDVDETGRLASTTRGTLAIGLELGWWRRSR